jgi:hypothetical protein
LSFIETRSPNRRSCGTGPIFREAMGTFRWRPDRPSDVEREAIMTPENQVRLEYRSGDDVAPKPTDSKSQGIVRDQRGHPADKERAQRVRGRRRLSVADAVISAEPCRENDGMADARRRWPDHPLLHVI